MKSKKAETCQSSLNLKKPFSKVKNDVDESSHSQTPPNCVHMEINYVGNIYIGSALAGL